LYYILINMESASEPTKEKKTDDEKREKKEKKTKKTRIQKDNDMIIESTEKLEVITSFDELNLREELLRGVYAYGFDKPSAV
jgi:superfamily II DNA/RNA helicase